MKRKKESVESSPQSLCHCLVTSQHAEIEAAHIHANAVIGVHA